MIGPFVVKSAFVQLQKLGLRDWTLSPNYHLHKSLWYTSTPRWSVVTSHSGFTMYDTIEQLQVASSNDCMSYVGKAYLVRSVVFVICKIISCLLGSRWHFIILCVTAWRLSVRWASCSYNTYCNTFFISKYNSAQVLRPLL